MKQQAFVLRISPNRIDRIDEALAENQIIIGWARAKDLLNIHLSWEEFREVIQDTFYTNEGNLRKAGVASGHMWRFIREMKRGDLVVVPYGSDFYVAKITGPATYDESKVGEDTAYRRNVEWLNDKKPIPRSTARAALVSRMKVRGACARATDLLGDIQECLNLAKSGREPTFPSDLQARLIRVTLDEIRKGRMDSFKFENLIREVLVRLGADDARVIPRNQDKGSDIIATFRIAGVIPQVLAVQAKHWEPDPPVGKDVVEQLIRGIEEGIDGEPIDLGMVITSGTISEEATQKAERYFEDKGIRIELVDGEQFAKLIVEHGIHAI